MLGRAARSAAASAGKAFLQNARHFRRVNFANYVRSRLCCPSAGNDAFAPMRDFVSRQDILRCGRN
jgi:hypothetical protein